MHSELAGSFGGVVAETSGFATDLAQSANLSTTMRRAIAAAQQRSHRYVTLEHLLLALLDDPDAQMLLESMHIDRSSMKARTTDVVNRSLATLYTPGQFDLRASYKVERVLQTASDDARRLNCTEVDASFVLAALAHESDSPAADIIKPTGLTFSNAMTWLYSNRGSSRAVVQPSDAMPEEDVVYDDDMSMGDDLDDLAFDLEILDDTPTSSQPMAKKGGLQKVPRPAEAAAKRPYPPGPPLKPGSQGAPKLAGKPVNGGAREAAIPPGPKAPLSSTREDVPPLPKRRVSPQVPPGDAEARRAEALPEQEAAASGSRAEPRPEIKVPSASRLEEMRVRSGGAVGTSSPPPSAPTGKAVVKGKQKPRHPKHPAGPPPGSAKQAARGSAAPTPGQMRRQRRQSWAEAYAGRLIENIPRSMRVATPERVEVRISRDETDAITKGFDGRGEIMHHEVLVSQAMSVMLRAPDGGFVIETLSPETQWTSDGSDHRTSGHYGRWRWVVTPKSAGDHRLQLIVAARSVDENGMTGDTALPDQVFNVRVTTNYLLSFKRALAWFVVMALGGVVTEMAVRALKIFEQ
jgi:hypothetical protein